ncbi:putative glucan endo-1,3-beta-D-glucosidase [Dioscorea sansibarensis]
MRVYGPDPKVLRSLQNTTVHLALGIPNLEIPITASRLSEANRWISRHVIPHHRFAQFRYLVIGNKAVNSPCSSLSGFTAITNRFTSLNLWSSTLHDVKTTHQL